jgi:FKBP-type peptidyl-prolyl cis-trans isomerase|tara:strand:- start:1989 stop:2795 length:807 start_codon:yes stop_codon:yes gene_type:complete
VPSEEAEAKPEYDADTLMYSMGYVMASQIDLEIGLSEKELELVLKGMRDQATGTPQPDDYNERATAIRDLFVTRRKAYQNEVNAKNTVIGSEALAVLKAEKNLMETESGLLYEIIEAGNQELLPLIDDSATINFDASHMDLSHFDVAENTTIRIRPTPKTLPGLIEGIQLIGEGGRVILYIPSEFAFGESPPSGADVEPGEALIFDVSLSRVFKAPKKASLPAGFDPSVMPSGPPMVAPPGPPPDPPPALPEGLKPPSSPPPSAANAK